MNENEFIDLKKDCDGFLIPSGDNINLKKGTKVKITQSLGGDYTLYVNGNLVKISGKDADAIGQKIETELKQEIIGFNAEAHATSLSWMILNDLGGETQLLSSAAATSLMTLVGVAILLSPVLVRTWRDFKEKT